MSQLAQAGASNTVPRSDAIRKATLVASSIDAASRTGTRPSNTVRTSPAEAPIATTPARLGATDPSGVRSTPFASPPAIRTTPSSSPTAAIDACGFVAFELSRNRTPSTTATDSPRCGSGVKVRIPSTIAPSAIPNAWAAAAHAAASARIAGVSIGRAPRSAPPQPAVAEARVLGRWLAGREPPNLAGGRTRDGGGGLVAAVPDVDVPRTLQREDPLLRRRVRVERPVPIQVIRR